MFVRFLSGCETARLTHLSLELGAGGGLTGLALALGLQRSGKRLPDPLLVTDLPILLPLQAQNIALNGLSSDVIKSYSLPWGSPLPADLPLAYRRPDMILAADCVYFEPAFPLLMETLKELMNVQEGEDEGAREPVCWFSMKKRRKADMRFIAALRKSFAVRELEVEREGEEEKNVHLWVSCALLMSRAHIKLGTRSGEKAGNGRPSHAGLGLYRHSSSSMTCADSCRKCSCEQCRGRARRLSIVHR
jgi:hypothetical protein